MRPLIILALMMAAAASPARAQIPGVSVGYAIGQHSSRGRARLLAGQVSGPIGTGGRLRVAARHAFLDVTGAWRAHAALQRFPAGSGSVRFYAAVGPSWTNDPSEVRGGRHSNWGGVGLLGLDVAPFGVQPTRASPYLFAEISGSTHNYAGAEWFLGVRVQFWR